MLAALSIGIMADTNWDTTATDLLTAIEEAPLSSSSSSISSGYNKATESSIYTVGSNAIKGFP